MEWIYENRTNGYDPFGCDAWGAKSFRERDEMSVRYGERQARRHADILKRQKDKKMRRENGCQLRQLEHWPTQFGEVTLRR